MTCGALGSGPFGATPFGSGFGFSASIMAEQRELNAILATLYGVPVIVDMFGADPLDPSSWALSFGPVVNAGSALPLVQLIEFVSATSVRVLLDAPCTAGQEYVLTYLPIVDVVCGVLGAAAFLAFAPPLGFGPNVNGQEQGRFDLANPVLVADAAGNVVELGTLQVDSTGDLAVETGLPYLRKRILRRLTTPQGAFLHLLTYGLAIPQKRNLRPSEMLRLKVSAQEQIQQEPDVLTALVSVSQPSPGSIVLFIRVQTVAGLTDQFETTIGGPSA